jgi:hypothetical protein
MAGVYDFEKVAEEIHAKSLLEYQTLKQALEDEMESAVDKTYVFKPPYRRFDGYRDLHGHLEMLHNNVIDARNTVAKKMTAYLENSYEFAIQTSTNPMDYPVHLAMLLSYGDLILDDIDDSIIDLVVAELNNADAEEDPRGLMYTLRDRVYATDDEFTHRLNLAIMNAEHRCLHWHEMTNTDNPIYEECKEVYLYLAEQYVHKKIDNYEDLYRDAVVHLVELQQTGVGVKEAEERVQQIKDMMRRVSNDVEEFNNGMVTINSTLQTEYTQRLNNNMGDALLQAIVAYFKDAAKHFEEICVEPPRSGGHHWYSLRTKLPIVKLTNEELARHEHLLRNGTAEQRRHARHVISVHDLHWSFLQRNRKYSRDK